MKRTHLDLSDYIIPGIVISFAIFCLIICCTGLGSCLVPDTGSSTQLYMLGNQMVMEENAEHVSMPFGYWVSSASTERVLKLRAWDGSWANWSYGGNTELDSGSGWLLIVTSILSVILCVAIAVVLGFGISFLIPRRWIESLYV